jgi:carbonic anhydrase
MAGDAIRPLPSYLAKRYLGWRATDYEDNKSWYQHLAEQGQHPRAMIISCCDSRIHAMSLFGAESGDFFIHRNIANLVPPYNEDGDHHGTSAAIEYAVQALKVAHIVVLGHSGCGGINSGYHACNGTQKELYENTTFIRKWLDILQPAFDELGGQGSPAEQIAKLEKQSIVVSLNNLMGFPFIAQAIADNRLTLHGLWHNIGTGELENYDPASRGFAIVAA